MVTFFNRIIIIVLLMMLISCNNDKKEDKVNGFDISASMSNIIYSYKKDSIYVIYIKSINKDDKAKIILKNSGNYVNPKYFKNEKSIISVYYPKNTLNPEFHFYDIEKGKITEKIKIGEGFISDYIYSANKIYYLQAKTFDSYSPIASKSYHNFDIYSLDLETLEINKISNSESYFMDEILKLNKNELLITVRGTSSKSGLFLLNINSTNDEQNFNKILIINDTLRNSEMYTNPVILPNGNILSASSYQMVELDLKSKMEYPILPSNGRHYKTIRNISNMIFYKQTDYTDNIYYFNLDNKIIQSLNVAPE